MTGDLSLLHVIGSLAPRYGGPAKVAELCTALAARGNHVEVASTDIDGRDSLAVPLSAPFEQDGFVSNVFAGAHPRRIGYSPQLARWLRGNIRRFDLVHVHGLYLFPPLVASRLCQRHDVPYVFQPHGGLNQYHRSHHLGRKVLYELLLERRNLRRAAAVRYDSVREREEAVAAGFPAGVVVPPGSPVPAACGAAQKSPRLVLHLGRLSQKKGVDLLLDAFAAVASEHPDVELVIAGPDDEDLGGTLAARADALGVSSRVRFAGLVTGAEKDDLLARACVFVLASADESFGASATEAMAYGVPTIVTRGVPIHADVAAADAGLVVDRDARAIAAALRLVLGDEDRAAELGRNGRELVVRKWSWESVAAELEGVYRDILARSDRLPLAEAVRV